MTSADHANPVDHLPIDALAPIDAVARLVLSQVEAASAVRAAVPAILAAAEAMSDTLSAGGTVAYAAAGSSGLMALADATELPGTFGLPPDRIRIVMAGGIPTSALMPGDTEDRDDEIDAGLAGLGPRDIVIVLSASGSTPFALAAVDRARGAGCKTVGIATREGTPLLSRADIAILLRTPDEVLDGSTRLGAATAQKIAMNAISTMVGIRLGHVHDGLMVNLRADNEKLHQRNRRIVAQLGRTDDAHAGASLERAGGDTKLAILIARGADPATGRTLLDACGGHLRTALQGLPNRMDRH